MKARPVSLFDDLRLRLPDAIELSLASLKEYGQRYQHWSIAYSGGKDSSATVTFVAWAVKSGLVPRPETLTVLYADTRMEFPPLFATAEKLMESLRADGINAQMVLPPLDDRFFVYMLGRGVPPPKNRFRWCTSQLKVEPMMAALEDLRQSTGNKLLSITGVRMGESEARDQRIALSCSSDTGECGQGWFHTSSSEAVADTLAPLLHWRVCHIFDWLYFENGRHGYPEVAGIADVYGDDDVRTGCIGCNLASRDTALQNLIRKPDWAHLASLTELKPLYGELTKPHSRLRKAAPETRKDGKYAKNGQRMGPLTMEARTYGLERVLDIQRRAQVNLIDEEEEVRIRELWSLNTWPNGWDGDEVRADVQLDQIHVIGDNELVTQPILVEVSS